MSLFWGKADRGNVERRRNWAELVEPTKNDLFFPINCTLLHFRPNSSIFSQLVINSGLKMQFMVRSICGGSWVFPVSDRTHYFPAVKSQEIQVSLSVFCLAFITFSSCNSDIQNNLGQKAFPQIFLTVQVNCSCPPHSDIYSSKFIPSPLANKIWAAHSGHCSYLGSWSRKR